MGVASVLKLSADVDALLCGTAGAPAGRFSRTTNRSAGAAADSGGVSDGAGGVSSFAMGGDADNSGVFCTDAAAADDSGVFCTGADDSGVFSADAATSGV